MSVCDGGRRCRDAGPDSNSRGHIAFRFEEKQFRLSDTRQARWEVQKCPDILRGLMDIKSKILVHIILLSHILLLLFLQLDLLDARLLVFGKLNDLV